MENTTFKDRIYGTIKVIDCNKREVWGKFIKRDVYGNKPIELDKELGIDWV